jgi:hypothetical protein
MLGFARSSRLPPPGRVSQRGSFIVLEVAGDAYTRGLQHGMAVADRIRVLRNRLFDQIIYRRGRVVGAGFASVLYSILAKMHPHIPREIREEMRGIADGAGVKYREILLFNCFDDMLHGLMKIGPAFQSITKHRFIAPMIGRFACSSFVVPAERSQTGGPLHGRNLDYFVSDEFIDPEWLVPKALRENVIVLSVRPDDGQPYASVTWPGFIGVVTGMNAAGLSLACHTSVVHRERIGATPMPFIYHSVMRHATTLDEAEWILRGSRRTIGNNLTMACSNSGEGRRFELSMDLFASHGAVDGLVRTTNHFQDPALKPNQEGWVVPSSEFRLDRMGQLFGEGTHGPSAACEALTDVTPFSPEQYQWDCMLNPGTIYGTVFEPAERRLWVRANDRADRQFEAVDLAAAWTT